ncbi:alpha/beta hydrolase [Devosia sp. Leaf64]|uniref:alpha/beta fold hydrolase n=1 Tax=Devosia sp. Leaf64 TaxID=1736229 RepID=UPI00138F8C73|nr:alpha/beta hydrolase [Devosia sp. Leaf64]
MPDALIYTQAAGLSQRGTILLSMGATASMAWWPTDFIEALADAGYRVISFDQRDTGRSTHSAPGMPPYDVPDLVEDVIGILDAYEVSSAHLMGMSLGGLVSQIAALKHPERVATITLFAAEPLNNTYDGEGIPAEMMEHFGGIGTLDWTSRKDVTRFLLRIAELSTASSRRFDREAALDRIGRELDQTSDIRAAFNHAMLQGKIDPSLDAKDIIQPTLIIHGEADPLISVAAANKTSELVQNAELVVLEDVGHEFTPAEVPPILKAIVGFIENATKEHA